MCKWTCNALYVLTSLTHACWVIVTFRFAFKTRLGGRAYGRPPRFPWLESVWIINDFECGRNDSRVSTFVPSFPTITQQQEVHSNMRLKRHYRWRPRCSRLYSHPTGTFRTVPSSSPCSCTLQRCIAIPEQGRNSVFSISSKRLCPRRTSTWKMEWKRRSISVTLRVGSKKSID